jgi:hypothetical protein
MSQVLWPDGYAPAEASVYVVNTRTVVASPGEVWVWLARPDCWPRYYANARCIRHLSGPWPNLEVGSRFRWVTFGTVVTSVVTECQPPARLAWTWRGIGARGHHGWVIVAGRDGCRIITEETVQGTLPRLLHRLVRPVMAYYHQRWLDGLADISQQRDLGGGGKLSFGRQRRYRSRVDGARAQRLTDLMLAAGIGKAELQILSVESVLWMLYRTGVLGVRAGIFRGVL